LSGAKRSQIKLFRIDGTVDADKWLDLTAFFVRGNELVLRYFDLRNLLHGAHRDEMPEKSDENDHEQGIGAIPLAVVSEWYQKGPRPYPRAFSISRIRLR
jgi:hypothetical protein